MVPSYHARYIQDSHFRHGKRTSFEGSDPNLLSSRRRHTPVQCGYPSHFHVFSADNEQFLLQWDQGRIVQFGWTSDERLAVLNEEGVYRLYDLQGDYRQYSLGSEAAELGIIDARIHDNGLVAMTSTLNLLEVKGWEGGKPLTLAHAGNCFDTPSLVHG